MPPQFTEGAPRYKCLRPAEPPSDQLSRLSAAVRVLAPAEPPSTQRRPRYWGPHRASQRTADRGCHRGRPRGTSAAEAHTHLATGPGASQRTADRGRAAGRGHLCRRGAHTWLRGGSRSQKQALAQDIGAHTEPAREPPIAAATAAGRGAPLPPRRTHLATRGKPQGRKNRLSPKILGPTPSQPENRRSRLPPRPAEGHLCRRGAHTWLRGGSRRDAKTGSRPRYWGPHRAS